MTIPRGPRYPRTFTEGELAAAFDAISRRAGLPQPSADRPKCNCPCPCYLPVLDAGGICPDCAASYSCTRRLYHAATRRQAVAG